MDQRDVKKEGEQLTGALKIAIFQFFFKINYKFPIPRFIYAFLRLVGYFQFLIFLFHIEKAQFGSLPNYVTAIFGIADSYIVT